MVQLNPPTDAVDQGAVANSNTAAETVSASERVARQRDFFATGQTRSRQFREAQLQKLKQAIEAHEDAILSALHKDLGKPEFEGFATEVTAKNDVDYALKHLKRWMSPRRVSTPLTLKPGRAYQQPEPLGVTLIISPWNYPFQLGIVPLIGAIAAGNCAILKPSEISPHTSALLAKLLSDTFDPDHIAVVEGDAQTSQALLAQKFDHIFFTGSTHIGRIVMKAAAEHLTPLTLELGGKSPCIVDANINLEVTAKRIVWGKFINAGQTCIAPDYLLVDQ
ncbi:MAG: aldehyde dehydrogenase family protein, partial [Cyanobacteria bacterium P01_H01_bin.119]